MDWVLDRSTKARDLPTSIPLPLPFHPSLPPPPPPPRPPTPPPPSAVNNFAEKISPNILLILAIVAVILFAAGLVNLFVRCLLRPRRRRPDHDVDSATALQGQLHQLFNLHDAGVDQSFIDTLPVFLYKAIVGLKDPFDCAVCLCEFEAEDKLRLLPSCSHAFHVQCIDTWLLSHSTCPLCGASLLSDFSNANSQSPILLVLDSASQSSRDPVRVADDALRASTNDASRKPTEVQAKEEAISTPVSVAAEAVNVVSVKLGKFRRLHSNEADQGTSNVNCSGDQLDQRRCFSMGAYEYIMDEESSPRVAIKPTKKRATTKKRPGHRLTFSECSKYHWKAEGLKGLDAERSQEFRVDHVGSTNSTMSNALQKKESFSISKTWLRAKNNKPNTAVEDYYSRRGFSFRLTLYKLSSGDESKLKSAVIAPAEIGESEKCDSKIDLDVEIGETCNKNSSVSRADETPSFARRTLLWIAGRQSRVSSEMDQI